MQNPKLSMICIHCSNTTPRHIYTFDVIFTHWLGVGYRVLSDTRASGNTDDIDIFYNGEIHREGISILPSHLLDEKGAHDYSVSYRGIAADLELFPCEDSQADLTFDVFSAVFWMISRYEEYLSFEADVHGRFEAQSSLAYKNHAHKIPLVDLWVKRLKDVIAKKFPTCKFNEEAFGILPTYDVDQAWSYLHKGAWRNFAGGVRDLLHGKASLLAERLRVLRGKATDPFDTYEYLQSLDKRFGLKPIYFFHPGTYGKFDKNVPLDHPALKRLIKDIDGRCHVGIHPSYRSFDEPDLLKKEIALMAEILGRPVTMARQHFLRIRLPHTYRRYIELGITDDHSLGYATDIGFRAGTSRSFHFYDLEQECATSLMIHPLSLMDGAYNIYQHLETADAVRQTEDMINILKTCNGRLITLWHNETLGDRGIWKGWRSVYENILQTSLKVK
jgi:hypothetical protein